MIFREFNSNQRNFLNLSFQIFHMKISLDALQILDAIDRHGSYAAAAASLYRVPSALTHAVQKLEGDLGVALFERQGRRAQLTPAGQALLDDGRHILAAAGELERRVQQVANGWEDELRIAVDVILPTERLFPLIERFYREGQPTRLRLSHEVLGGTWDALATGRADLAIGAPGDRPARSGISSRTISQSLLVFAISPDHPLARVPEPIPTSELQRHRAVALADTSRELAARTTGLLPGQEALRVPDMASKAKAQAAGLGVGHLPRWLADPEIAAGRLVLRQLAEPRTPMPLNVAWRTRHEGKALQWFLETLQDAAFLADLTAGLD